MNDKIETLKTVKAEVCQTIPNSYCLRLDECRSLLDDNDMSVIIEDDDGYID